MDDIDIEEHDVLDNPAIKCVFPDLSLLKQEINEYYNDEPSIKEEPDARLEEFSESHNIVNVCDDNYFEKTNTQKSQTKIFLGSKPNADTQNEDDDILTVDFKPYKCTKIVSNEQYETAENVKRKHMKLILQDIKSYLDQNARYCKICCRLFLRNKAFCAHNNNVHNKLMHKEKVKQTNAPLLKCSICSIRFTRKANLMRHYRNIHRFSATFKHKNIRMNQNLQMNTKHSIQSCNKRNKCNISFDSNLNLKRHNRIKHRPKITSILTKQKDGKHEPLYKTVTVASALNDTVAIPLTRKRKNESASKHLNQNSRYCKLCCRLFASKHALIIHNSKAHPKKIPKNNHMQINANNTQSKCGLCGYCFANNANLMRHYKNIHQIRKIIMCNICNIGFSTQYGLKRHCSNLHGTKNIIDSKLNNVAIDCATNKKQVLQDSEASASKKSKFSNAKVINDTHKNVLASNCGIRKVILAKKHQQVVETSKDNSKTSCQSVDKNPCTKSATPEVKVENKLVVCQITDDGIKANNKMTLGQESAIIHANNTTSKNIMCQHCNKLFPDQQSLIDHMYHVLKQKKISNGDSHKLEISGSNSKEKDENELFVCRQCSYYLPTIDTYFTHMNRNHKTQIFLKAKKEKFVTQCKYCSYKSSSIATHNKHIRSYHIYLMFKKIENELINDYNISKQDKSENINGIVTDELYTFALEKLVFECQRCNVCFLSSNNASDHKKHMEDLVNWKCLTCRRIFKLHDKKVHLKQHSFIGSIEVLALDEACNVLYNCTKCAIHFTEKRYQEHYPNCESETTDSTYCKICDILIDSMEWIHHKRHEHSEGISDFTIIESNMIVNGTIRDKDSSDSKLEARTKIKNEKRAGTIDKQEDSDSESDVYSRLTLREYTSVIQNKKSLDIGSDAGFKVKLNDQHNCLTYCPACKCFHTDLGAKYKSHINGTCYSVLKYACNLCGLVLTHSVLALHKERHKKEKKLCLQDFKFFDLRGQQIRPPTPDYPHCENCGIHFLRKNVIHTHICNETDYIICDVCNIKLTETAYKLHMTFHFYVIQKTVLKNTNILVNELSKSQASKTIHQTLSNIQYNETTVGKKKCTTGLIDEQQSRQIPDESLVAFLYSCRTCGLSVDSYDEVVSHCQNHYSGIVNQTSVKKCKQCSLTFENRHFVNHQQRVHSSVSKCNVLKFDPRHFTSKTTIWVRQIFQTLPDDVVNPILEKSMYHREHRIKFEKIQESSVNVYAYKCDKCGIFIDPSSVYTHTQNPCAKTRKYLCSFCDVPFSSNFSRNSHEKLHVQFGALKRTSFNIILFNQAKDKMYNKRIFCSTNPYILYQCRNCSGLVEESMRTDHMCDKKSLVKCLTCGLLINKNDFNTHSNKHTYLENFCSENFKVILFGRKIDNNINEEILKEHSSSFNGAIYDYTLYKCDICDVCLKNKENHTCVQNFKLEKMCSTCSECDLYFPSLKHHIKQHRTDANFVRDNMNIITFNKCYLVQINENDKDAKSTAINADDHNLLDNIEVGSDDYYENHLIEQHGVIGEHNYASAEEKRATNTTDSEIDIDASKNQDNTIDSTVDGPEILYKCIICGLHFISKQIITGHIKKCHHKAKQYKQNCSKCHLLFNQSELFSHIVAHHRGNSQVNDFKVIEMSMKDIME